MSIRQETKNQNNYYVMYILLILAIFAGVVAFIDMTTENGILLQEAFARCFQEWCYAPDEKRNCGDDVCS